LANLLNIGLSGLNASKKSLETTGHNISNANTEGYSRQRVHQATAQPVVRGGLIQGTGTVVTGINRMHDKHLEKRLENATSSHEYFKTRADQLSQVETIFDEIDGEGLTKVLNKFYNSFRDLANQPENETIRSVVRDNAQLVIKDIKRIRGTLDSVSRNIDSRIQKEVEDINITMKQIAKINKKIASLEATGDETGDLRDMRDRQILELSKSFEIQTYIDEKGRHNVSAKGVGTLVAGAVAQQLQADPQSKAESSNGMDGSLFIHFKGSKARDITTKFRNGRFASLIEVRNKDLRTLQEKTDNVAFDLAGTVNAVHRRGFVSRSIPTGPDGSPASSDAKGPTTGINFFANMTSRKDAAKQLMLSQEVAEDLTNIATGLSPNSPGDNRVAIAISKLQHERVAEGGQSTLEEYYLKTIGQVGLEAGKAQMDSEQTMGLLAQTRNIKERISGVSLDEEAANMVKYQHAYEASAKVMQAANEMFDTVLGIKR
jgi:flagellar hook-associated protein 1 FlgK